MSNRSSPLLDSRVNAVIDPLEAARRREVTAWYYPSELYGINHLGKESMDYRSRSEPVTPIISSPLRERVVFTSSDD